MKLPRVRHRIIRPETRWLDLATDKRATSEGRFNGSSGGGGSTHWLHKEQVSTVQKECDKLLKKLGNSAQGNKRSSTGTDGVG